MSDQGEKPKANMKEQGISRRGFLKSLAILAGGGVIASSGIDVTNAKANSNPNHPSDPGKPGELYKPASISDGWQDPRNQARESSEKGLSQEVKQIGDVPVITQGLNGEITKTDMTLKDLGQDHVDFANAIFTTLQPTGLNWITPGTVDFLVVSKEGKTLQESVKEQEGMYIRIKENVDGRESEGSLLVVKRVPNEQSTVTFLPITEKIANDINEFTKKFDPELQKVATKDNIRYTIHDHNGIMIWVDNAPVAISNYVNKPTDNLSDSFIGIPSDEREQFMNGFIFTADEGETDSGIISTPDGGYYLVDKGQAKKTEGIKSINLKNNTYIDLAGNRGKIRRLPEGSLGVIKDKKFEIWAGKTMISPSFSAIFEKWGEDMVAIKDGEKAILKVAIIKIPANGRLVDAKFVFGEKSGVVSGVTKVNNIGQNTETEYKSTASQDFINMLAPGCQVWIDANTKDSYDKYIADGKYKLDSAEKKLIYDIVLPADSLKSNLNKVQSGSRIDSNELVFVGNIAIPETK